MSGKKLTDKQEIFCNEYVKDRNATKAAIAAGYSESSAKQIGSKNMTNIDVVARVLEIAGDVCAEAKTDAVWLLKTLRACFEAKISDIMDEKGAILPVEEWPELWQKLVGSFTVEETKQGFGDDAECTGYIKKVDILKGKAQILKMIGDHVDVSAFEQRLSVTIEDKTADRLSSAKKRMRGDLEHKN